MGTVCICGKRVTEKEVSEAKRGINHDIIFLPGDRMAEIGWLSRRLISVGAEPARTFDGVIRSLVDQMCKLLIIKPNDDDSGMRKEEADPKCFEDLRKVKKVMLDLLGEFSQNLELKKIFINLSKSASEELQRKLTVIYFFLFNESLEKKPAKKTA